MGRVKRFFAYRSFIVFFLLFTLVSTVAGYRSTYVFSIDEPVNDYNSFVKRLKHEEFKVKYLGNTKMFFRINGWRIDADGALLNVWEFEDIISTDNEAKYVNPQGFGMDRPEFGIRVRWASTPHFFKRGKIIVLYVGTDKKILALLNSMLGEQFAGM